MQDLFWGGADFEKMGWGLPPQKLITFDPYICIIVILVNNCLHFVNFFHLFFS